jgi:hypothetical protein
MAGVAGKALCRCLVSLANAFDLESKKAITAIIYTPDSFMAHSSSDDMQFELNIKR